MSKSTPQKIIYGIHATDLGDIVIAQSDKGLCWLGFMVTKEQGAYKGNGFSRMKDAFEGAHISHDQTKTKKLLYCVMNAWEKDDLRSIALDMRGSDFQLSVWEALLDIPKGQTVSYSDIANDINMPKAARSVGSAIGDNPVSLIVPCHRVIQKSGGLGNYGWGLDLKRKLLALENAA